MTVGHITDTSVHLITSMQLRVFSASKCKGDSDSNVRTNFRRQEAERAVTGLGGVFTSLHWLLCPLVVEASGISEYSACRRRREGEHSAREGTLAKCYMMAGTSGTWER